MKQIILIILSVVALAGCHTGKSAAEGAAEKRAKFVADSVKYEAVKDAFIKGEFVFKINRENNTTVIPTENWIIFSDGKIRKQYTLTKGPAISWAGEIRGREMTYNPKKKTITLKVEIIGGYIFKLTLYENSDKAYGDKIDLSSTSLYEGWIEPLNDASIVRGWESPIYK